MKIYNPNPGMEGYETYLIEGNYVVFKSSIDLNQQIKDTDKNLKNKRFKTNPGENQLYLLQLNILFRERKLKSDYCE